MSFIPNSAASSVTKPSISGSSSLLPLLRQLSTLALQFAQTPEGAAFIAKLIESSLDPAHPSHIPRSPGTGTSEKEPISAQGSQRADKLPFAHFVRLVRNASPALRMLPVTAIESYQHGGENAGLIPHRYSLITLHLRAIEGSFASVLTAELADDRAALVRPSDRRLAALESAAQGPPLTGGPSLDALAALLDIVDKRVGKYDLHGRNCLWLADLVLFGCALKFRAHWLAHETGARVFPDAALQPFLRGEADAITATARCFVPAGLPMWLGDASAALGRVFGVFDMQHEVEDVAGKWRDFVGAVVPTGVWVAEDVQA